MQEVEAKQHPGNTEDSWEDDLIAKKELAEAISSLKLEKTAGIDSITTEVLKYSSL